MDLTCSEALGEDVGVACGRVQNCRPRAPVRMVQDGSSHTTMLQRQDSRGWQLGQLGEYDKAQGGSAQLLGMVGLMKQDVEVAAGAVMPSVAGLSRVNEEETGRNHPASTGSTMDFIVIKEDCILNVVYFVFVLVYSRNVPLIYPADPKAVRKNELNLLPHRGHEILHGGLKCVAENNGCLTWVQRGCNQYGSWLY